MLCCLFEALSVKAAPGFFSVVSCIIVGGDSGFLFVISICEWYSLFLFLRIREDWILLLSAL